MLCLASSVTRDQDDATDGLAVDLRDVVLEEAVVAVRAGEPELLVLIQGTDREHDRSDGFPALHDAVQHRPLHSGVVGHIVDPRREVVLESGIAASKIFGKRGLFGRHDEVLSFGIEPVNALSALLSTAQTQSATREKPSPDA